MVGKLFAVIVAMGVVLLGAPAHGQPPPPFPAADAAAAVAAARDPATKTLAANHFSTVPNGPRTAVDPAAVTVADAGVPFYTPKTAPGSRERPHVGLAFVAVGVRANDLEATVRMINDNGRWRPFTVLSGDNERKLAAQKPPAAALVYEPQINGYWAWTDGSVDLLVAGDPRDTPTHFGSLDEYLDYFTARHVTANGAPPTPRADEPAATDEPAQWPWLAVGGAILAGIAGLAVAGVVRRKRTDAPDT